jgi:hypothetical protein
MLTKTFDCKLLCTLLCTLSFFLITHRTAGLARIVPACGGVALCRSKQHVFVLISISFSDLLLGKMLTVSLVADAVPKGGQHAGKLRVEDFLDIKKTQLKGAKAESVTDKKKVNGQHSDGAPLVCTVQGMDKHGDGFRQASCLSCHSAWHDSSGAVLLVTHPVFPVT